MYLSVLRATVNPLPHLKSTLSGLNVVYVLIWPKWAHERTEDDCLHRSHFHIYTHSNIYYTHTLVLVSLDVENERAKQHKVLPYHFKEKLYKQCIDDILLFWEETRGSYLNILKFTCEESIDTINDMDLTTHKDETGDIHTSINRKDMERNSLSHAASHHPKHLKDKIPVGQFLRLKSNGSDLDDHHGSSVQGKRLCLQIYTTCRYHLWLWSLI